MAEIMLHRQDGVRKGWGTIPDGLVELDAGFIERMVQSAYEQGRRDQAERSARRMADTLDELRKEIPR